MPHWLPSAVVASLAWEGSHDKCRRAHKPLTRTFTGQSGPGQAVSYASESVE